MKFVITFDKETFIDPDNSPSELSYTCLTIDGQALPDNIEFHEATRSLKGTISVWSIQNKTSIQKLFISDPIELVLIATDPLGKKASLRIILEAVPDYAYFIKYSF